MTPEPTVDECRRARRLVEICRDKGLEGASELDDTCGTSELARCHRDMPIKWCPLGLHSMICNAFPEIRPAFLIRDWQEAHPDPLVSHEEINDMFVRNAVKLIKGRYGWWRPARYRRIKAVKSLGVVANSLSFIKNLAALDGEKNFLKNVWNSTPGSDIIPPVETNGSTAEGGTTS
jgi:hypothetical protein